MCLLEEAVQDFAVHVPNRQLGFLLVSRIEYPSVIDQLDCR